MVYFFKAPEAGQNYLIYRAIADYDSSTEETRVMILAFDIYIQDDKILGGVAGSTEKAVAEAQKWDVDIAYGYETIQLSAAETDQNLKMILSQIDTRYAPLVKNRVLESIEML